jgi:hypothetical protein
MQGDFLLNGNLRVPGECRIGPDFVRPFFEQPPPKIEIGLDRADLRPLMLADWGPGGFVVNFETYGNLTIGPTPPEADITQYWITFLRTLA